MIVFLTLALVQAVIVEPPVMVSPQGSGNHWFTNIAADPADAHRLIACGIRSISRTASWQGFVYRSTDGGATWTTVLVDTAAQLVSEESCAFGPDGHAYFIAQGWNQHYEERRLGDGILRLYRSVDGGASWTPVIVDPTFDAWMDYARIAVDNTNGQHRGRVYIFSNAGTTIGHDPTQVVAPMRHSLDDGLHFSNRVALPLDVKPAGGFPESVVVLPSGIVVAGYANRYAPDGGALPPPDTTKLYTPRPMLQLMQAVRSSDAGRSLERPITIASGSDFPSLAVDASDGPHRGRLYATWTDTIRGVSHVLISTSDDEGKTWGSKHLIDSTALSPIDARLPHVAVNRDGVVGVSWTEGGICWYFNASRDGGHTFPPRVPLNACPRQLMAAFDPNAHLSISHAVWLVGKLGPADFRRRGFTLTTALGGGAAGITADAGGTFHPLWSIGGTDGRLWTARVVVRPADAPPPPMPETSLTGLRDVSPRVAYAFTSEDYDAGTGLLTVELSVVNVDSIPIRGPIRLELTRVESGVANRVEVVNADNHASAPDAVWNVTAGSDGALAPYARSAPVHLVFRFPNGLTGGRMRFDPQNPDTIMIVADLAVFAPG